MSTLRVTTGDFRGENLRNHVGTLFRVLSSQLDSTLFRALSSLRRFTGLLSPVKSRRFDKSEICSKSFTST